MRYAAPGLGNRSIFVEVDTIRRKLGELRRLNRLDTAQMNIFGVEVEQVYDALKRSIESFDLVKLLFLECC